MKIKKQVSIFLCLLIVLFPIAIAQELTVTQWSGEDEVNGYIRGQDTLQVKAEAMIPWENKISNSQMKICTVEQTGQKCIDTGAWQNFDACTQKTGKYYECTYTKAFNNYNNELKFQVDLYDDDNRLAKYEQKTLIVDVYPPKILEFIVKPKATLGPVNLAYVVEDYGVNPSTADKCSGIYEVEFTIDGEAILTDRENTKGVCKKTKGINYVYEGEEISVTICATAKDYLGRESPPVCDTFVLDEGNPEIKEIAIVDNEGSKITHVKTGKTMPVRIRAKITDESEINDSTVKAELKDLTGITGEKKYDTKEGDYYYWNGLTISEGSKGTIKVKAEDVVRNKAEKKLDFNISTDDTGPEFIDVYSAVKDEEERPILNYNSYLAVKFSEKSSMSLAKAYIDLSQLGMESNVQASSCVKIENNVWECKWKINPPKFGTEINGGIKLLTLKSNTQDNLGNTLGTNEAIEIYYQNKGPIEPSIIEFKVIPGADGVGGEAVKGDTVHFKVGSSNFETAEADFSEIGGEEETIPISCEFDDMTERDVCIFEQTVLISGPAEAQINFTFTDIFQEYSSIKQDLIIYEIKGETRTNYWTNRVECSPMPIDRKTTSQLPQTIVCKIDLTTSTRNLDTVNIIGPSSIYDCMGNITGFIDDIRIINNVPGSREPYFMIKLPARDYYLNNLGFTCPLTIYSKNTVQKLIHKTPEIELIDMNFTFYDMPLGELYTKTEKKIKSAVDSAEDLLEVTEGFQEIMRVAEDICGWKNVITSAISTVTAVVVLLGGMQDTFRSTLPPVADAIKIIRSPICGNVREPLDYTFTTELFGILDQACSIVNCQASGGKEMWNVGRWTGGASPWCMEFEKALGESGDLAAGMNVMNNFGVASGEAQSTVKYWSGNMKDNIYQSIVCLCLPGIIRNIDKMAQIKCKYATCLEKDYKEKGVPLEYCDETKYYLNCAYVWGGPLFDLIPFSNFFESISQTLGELIANPVTILTTVLGTACDLYCETEPTAFHTVCAVARVTSEIGESVASIKAMTDRKNEMGLTSGEWCEEMKEWSEDKEPIDDDEEVLPFE